MRLAGLELGILQLAEHHARHAGMLDNEFHMRS
jgi:hypothetical protein